MGKRMPPRSGGGSGDRQDEGGQGPEQKGPRFKGLIWYVLAGIALLLVIQYAASGADRQEISYSTFRDWVKEDKVQSVVLHPDHVEGTLVGTDDGGKPKKFVATWQGGDNEIYNLMDDHKVDYEWDTDWLQNILLWFVLPLALIFLLWRFLFSRSGPASNLMQFGRSRAKMVMQKDIGVTFDDVAGIEESKEELEEIVEFLQSPGRFTRLGGKIPKGVLLVGAPGTGKTLLAKAVAGEASVPFFSLSGSDFVEMFVGVGAARVRDLFEQANKVAPCIIFIDELDALGKARGTGMMGGHDEREQTLNALLVQMDGMQTTKGIILLAATNRPEMLDPALLRPGRFDRHIAVPRPDLKGREKILEVHVREVRLDSSVSLRRVAAMTPGFVGADLANLVNEAALLAARRDKDAVEFEDFEDAVERVVAGLEKRNRLMNDQEKEITAHHESGHALVACLVPGADPVRKVSMVPRGVAALGYTMQLPQEDRYLLRKGELMDRLAVMLGGRAAEIIMFGEISTGAQNDLQKATSLAHEMVTQYGMSEELGPLSYPSNDGSPFSGDGFMGSRWSERTSREVDKAVRKLVEEALERSKKLLADNKPVLERMASMLLEKEVLEETELRDILCEFGIKLPRRKYHRKDEEAKEAEREEEAATVAEAGTSSGGDDQTADPGTSSESGSGKEGASS